MVVNFAQKLGKGIFLSIIKEWLVINDIGRLDSANCNHQSGRKYFLESLALPYCTTWGVNVPCSQRYLDFIYSKNIRVRHLEFKRRFGKVQYDAKFSYEGEILSSMVSLSLTDFRLEDIISMDAFLGSMRQLQTLHLQNISGDYMDQFSSEIALRCKHLTSVTLKSMRTITNDHVSMILQSCAESLTELNISACNLITPLIIDDIATLCTPQLVALRLEYICNGVYLTMSRLAQQCSNLSVLSFKASDEIASPEGYIDIISHCTHITDLNMHCSSDTVLHCIANSLSGLRKLNINHSRRVTDDAMVRLCTYCTLLSELHIASCSKLTEVSLLAITNNLKHLSHIEFGQHAMASCSKAMTFTVLASKFIHLTLLDLTSCEMPGEPLPLGEQILLTPRDLRVMFPPAANTTISDDTVLSCGRTLCSQSQLTSLTWLRSITSNAWLEFASYSLYRLTALNLSSTQFSGNRYLLPVAESCRLLTQLNLNGWRTMDSVGLVSVIEKNHKLTDLSCMSCAQLDGRALVALSIYCRRLKSLAITHADGITEPCYKLLASNCQQLTHVDFSSCGNLTDEAVLYLARNCKNLVALGSKNCIRVGGKCLDIVYSAHNVFCY